MRVKLLAPTDAGFVKNLDIPEGQSVLQLLIDNDYSSEESRIRVNGSPVSADQILHDGDVISITAAKIDGA